MKLKLVFKEDFKESPETKKFPRHTIIAIDTNGKQVGYVECKNVREISKHSIEGDEIKGYPKKIRLLWMSYEYPDQVRLNCKIEFSIMFRRLLK